MDAAPPDLAEHWDKLHSPRTLPTLTWYQESPAVSLALLDALGVSSGEAVIDVGGGTSTLVDALIGGGFGDLSVLDLSQTALDQARRRLGTPRLSRDLAREDVLTWHPRRRHDVWHDRAMSHFLVEHIQRDAYLATLRAGVRSAGKRRDRHLPRRRTRAVLRPARYTRRPRRPPRRLRRSVPGCRAPTRGAPHPDQRGATFTWVAMVSLA